MRAADSAVRVASTGGPVARLPRSEDARSVQRSAATRAARA